MWFSRFLDVWHQWALQEWAIMLRSRLRAGKVKQFVTQLCPTLCDPMDCSLPVYPAHRILQARILEWVVILFSRRSSQPRDLIQVSRIAGGFFIS